jgi:hypothetical protein
MYATNRRLGISRIHPPCAADSRTVARVASWQLVACWHRTSDEIGLRIVKGNRKKPPGVREGADESLPPGSGMQVSGRL